jgi:hypothetical protein
MTTLSDNMNKILDRREERGRKERRTLMEGSQP